MLYYKKIKIQLNANVTMFFKSAELSEKPLKRLDAFFIEINITSSKIHIKTPFSLRCDIYLP